MIILLSTMYNIPPYIHNILLVCINILLICINGISLFFYKYYIYKYIYNIYTRNINILSHVIAVDAGSVPASRVQTGRGKHGHVASLGVPNSQMREENWE